MKHGKRIVMLLLLSMAVTACSQQGDITSRVSKGNTVDQVINDQIGKADKSKKEEKSTDQNEEATPQPKSGQEADSSQSESLSTEVDYDLTKMSSDMVYATIYQMMVEPDPYIGKVVRMDGLYSVSYYEPTAQYYHYCLIQDALACCSQGIEFVWDDGKHIYPDEYPEEYSEIIVQGVFETYTEDGDDNLYCRIKDATLEVIKD